MTKALVWIAAISFTVLSDTGRAAEIKVLASGGFRAAYLALLPEFERTTGHKAVTTWGRPLAPPRAQSQIVCYAVRLRM